MLSSYVDVTVNKGVHPVAIYSITSEEGSLIHVFCMIFVGHGRPTLCLELLCPEFRKRDIFHLSALDCVMMVSRSAFVLSLICVSTNTDIMTPLCVRRCRMDWAVRRLFSKTWQDDDFSQKRYVPENKMRILMSLDVITSIVELLRVLTDFGFLIHLPYSFRSCQCFRYCRVE